MTILSLIIIGCVSYTFSCIICYFVKLSVECLTQKIPISEIITYLKLKKKNENIGFIRIEKWKDLCNSFTLNSKLTDLVNTFVTINKVDYYKDDYMSYCFKIEFKDLIKNKNLTLNDCLKNPNIMYYNGASLLSYLCGVCIVCVRNYVFENLDKYENLIDYNKNNILHCLCCGFSQANNDHKYIKYILKSKLLKNKNSCGFSAYDYLCMTFNKNQIVLFEKLLKNAR